MRMIIPIIVTATLATPAASTQSDQPKRQMTDRCHVYVVDVEQTEKLMREIDELPDPDEAQLLALKKKYPDSERILGEFEARVGEEVLTTKSYQIPGTRQFVTASVYYTDEMMRSTGSSESMNMAIVVSPRRHENAMSVDNNSTSQISYNDSTDKVQVKTRMRIEGRVRLIGLECQVRKKT